MTRIPDEFPVEPPDTHGKLAKYNDLAQQKKVPCKWDDDECTFAKHCPLYEPAEYDFWEGREIREYPEIQITCKFMECKEKLEITRYLQLLEAIEEYQQKKRGAI